MPPVWFWHTTTFELVMGSCKKYRKIERAARRHGKVQEISQDRAWGRKTKRKTKRKPESTTSFARARWAACTLRDAAPAARGGGGGVETSWPSGVQTRRMGEQV
jgi:hypothetical protein